MKLNEKEIYSLCALIDKDIKHEVNILKLHKDLKNAHKIKIAQKKTISDLKKINDIIKDNEFLKGVVRIMDVDLKNVNYSMFKNLYDCGITSDYIGNLVRIEAFNFSNVLDLKKHIINKLKEILLDFNK
jgi:hypothetical protein